jgi:hypothetical protein
LDAYQWSHPELLPHEEKRSLNQIKQLINIWFQQQRKNRKKLFYFMLFDSHNTKKVCAIIFHHSNFPDVNYGTEHPAK